MGINKERMSDRLYIFDTTLRDGEQVPGCQLNTAEKVEIARQLERLGVDVIEAGFPVSSPGDFDSVVEISKAVSEPVVCALSRAVERDIETAAESLRYAKRRRIHTGIGTSDYHIRYKFASTREDILRRAVAAVACARRYTDEVEFFAEDAGRTDNEYLARVVDAVIRAGASIVNIPDTTGFCFPEDYAAKISYLREHVDGIDRVILSTHCHDDLGMATANALSGVKAGARQVEVTVNGIGERAGNTALEEVVTALRCHPELGITTSIDSKQLYRTSRMVSTLMNMPVQANKSVVGRNAFAHSCGIHQDGVLKNSSTYEIINPADIGIDTAHVMLTARSGHAAIKNRLHVLGIDIKNPNRLNAIYDRFLKIADRKKQLTDAELVALAMSTCETRAVRLDYLQVTSGVGVRSMAIIGIDISGQKFEASASGNGPIDASIKALKKIIDRQMTLSDYAIQAISRGSDGMAGVRMQVEYAGRVYYGMSTNTDIVAASVEAYIDCINKFK